MCVCVCVCVDHSGHQLIFTLEVWDKFLVRVNTHYINRLGGV